MSRNHHHYHPRNQTSANWSSRSSSSSYYNHDKNATSHSSKVRAQIQTLKEDDSDNNAPSILGTCPFMCPEKERSQRERLRDLAVFERLHGNPAKSSSTLAVKKFCRTISLKDVQASDLRPLSILEETLDYLMRLLDSSDHSFLVLHDFIFDRTRSIRQDLSMQNINNDRVICMYEKIVRFHAISHQKLIRCEGDSTTLSSIHHLNKEQLTKCLASLYNLYDINRTSDSLFSNEAEFRSLYVLFHLNSQSNSVLIVIFRVSLYLYGSLACPHLLLAQRGWYLLESVKVFPNGQFWNFFRTVASEATCLQLCIIEPYIVEVRAHAVACIDSSGYKLHPYPLTLLSKILMIKESDLEIFCNACGLLTNHDDMGNRVLPTKQTGFSNSKGQSLCNLFPWLESSSK